MIHSFSYLRYIFSMYSEVFEPTPLSRYKLCKDRLCHSFFFLWNFLCALKYYFYNSQINIFFVKIFNTIYSDHGFSPTALLRSSPPPHPPKKGCGDTFISSFLESIQTKPPNKPEYKKEQKSTRGMPFLKVRLSTWPGAFCMVTAQSTGHEILTPL